MQYTIRNVPPNLDAALRQRAREEHKSLNQIALEAMTRFLGLSGQAVKQRDLADIAGTWEADPQLEEALEDQRRVDPELWR